METIIEKMEKNLSTVQEIYGKKGGNENCPVMKKAQPMITYLLNEETEAYHSFRKSCMFKKAGKEILAGEAADAASQALEEADKTIKGLTSMMKNGCPYAQNNLSCSCTTHTLAKPDEVVGLSVHPIFNTKKLI